MSGLAILYSCFKLDQICTMVDHPNVILYTESGAHHYQWLASLIETLMLLNPYFVKFQIHELKEREIIQVLIVTKNQI
jgi:hypothetical protein